MKRPLSLVSFIVSTAMISLYTAVYIMGSYVILALIGEYIASPEGIIIVGVVIGELALFILGIIFNAISIARVLKKPSEFKKGAVITAIVFNFIIFLLMMLSLTEEVSMLNVITGIALLATNILVIIDLCKEGKRKQKDQQLAQSQETATEEN